MTYRSHGRGTPILRMRFRGIGKIERATGFDNPDMVNRLKEMLRVLYQEGKDDVLRDIKLGHTSLRAIWAVYKTGRWQRLPTAAHAMPFADTWTTWLKSKSKKYQRFAGWVHTALTLESVGTLADVRKRLLQYRTSCEATGKAAMFNRAHATVRAMLRDVLTTDHVLYHEVAAIKGLTEKPKRKGNAQAPADAAVIREVLSGEAGRIWWFMCCSGAMPDEVFGGKCSVEDGVLHIKGTKRAARDRWVPLLVDVPGVTLTQAGFASAMKRAKLGCTPYDGRRSFGLWCDLAGLPEAWKGMLLGHALANITQLYGFRESQRIVEQADEKLRALLVAANVTVPQREGT